MKYKPYTVLSLFIVVTSCAFFNRKEKFDHTRWIQNTWLDSPDRNLMADDLINSHKLIGLSNKQMLRLLGEPENDTTTTYYTLAEKYDMIDPVSGKNLVITFNKDSIITSAKIKEWHKH